MSATLSAPKPKPADEAERGRSAGVKSCVNCLFAEGRKCVWLDVVLAGEWPCGGAHWMGKPHPAKKSYAEEWLAYFERMKAAYPEYFEDVDLDAWEAEWRKNEAAQEKEAASVTVLRAKPEIAKGDGVSWVLRKSWGLIKQKGEYLTYWHEIDSSHPAETHEVRKAA